MKLLGKIVIVTGASSGVGKEIALRFAQEGAIVIAAARRIENLRILESESEALHGQIVAYPCDVSVETEAEALVDFAVNTFGKIDILVNNAGTFDSVKPVGEADDGTWEKVMGTNINGPFYTMRKAVSYMLKQKDGNLINIASVAGLHGCRGGAAYTASKFALVGLTKNTAFMYANQNIRCNVICPGAVRTEIVTKGVGYEDASQLGQTRLQLSSASCPGCAEPEDIASVALFLASDDSKFLNGTSITADAGWTAC